MKNLRVVVIEVDFKKITGVEKLLRTRTIEKENDNW